jgi:hypothetical protein
LLIKPARDELTQEMKLTHKPLFAEISSGCRREVTKTVG